MVDLRQRTGGGGCGGYGMRKKDLQKERDAKKKEGVAEDFFFFF